MKPELRLPVHCDECANKERIIRQYAENHSKLVEEVASAHEVARAAGKEVTKLKGLLTKQAKESVRADQIEMVAERWRYHRPKTHIAFAKPGSKSYTVIEKALALMAEDDMGPVAACCEAVDGLHLAPWQKFDQRYATPGEGRTLRNSVEHALGDEDRIERCRRIRRWVANHEARAFDVWQTVEDTSQAWLRAWSEQHELARRETET